MNCTKCGVVGEVTQSTWNGDIQDYVSATFWCSDCNVEWEVPFPEAQIKAAKESELYDFTQALRRASLAHPDLRIGQLIEDALAYAWVEDGCDEHNHRWHLDEASNTDLTDALNKFAKESK